MEKEGLNSALFADKIGVSRGTITHVLSGRNKPSLEVVQKILDTFPAVNAEWLLVGKSPMYDHEKIFLHPQQESIAFEDENQTLNPPKNEANVYKESKASEYPQKSIDKVPVEVAQSIQLKEITDVISSNRKINKIIIFYDDETFVSFPSEK
jgi:transcriptional regulator with XRE-family HTH domain